MLVRMSASLAHQTNLYDLFKLMNGYVSVPSLPTSELGPLRNLGIERRLRTDTSFLCRYSQAHRPPCRSKAIKPLKAGWALTMNLFSTRGIVCFCREIPGILDRKDEAVYTRTGKQFWQRLPSLDER